MKNKISILIITAVLAVLIISCEKQIDTVNVTYRIVNFQDGFSVLYKHQSDTLDKEIVTGAYTLATPWTYSFKAEPGDILYVSMSDTVENSFSRVQVLVNGKIFKEKSRSLDRYMPVVVSGVVLY